MSSCDHIARNALGCATCLQGEVARLTREFEEWRKIALDYKTVGDAAERRAESERARAEAADRAYEDLDRMWSEACEVAAKHCPVEVGESHIRQGIPRLAARAERAEAELARVRASRDGARDAASMNLDERDEARQALAASQARERVLREALERIADWEFSYADSNGNCECAIAASAALNPPEEGKTS